jgi:solute carrier family 50 (sugar transporter)
MTNVVFELVCPLIGTLIAIAMFASPFPAVSQARQKSDLGPLNPIPWVVAFFNCIGWTFYGCLRKDHYLFWANMPGICLSMYYSLTAVALLAKRDSKEAKLKLHLVEGGLISAVFFWTFLAMLCSFLLPDMAAFLIGSIACAGCLAYYISPFSSCIEIIQKRDASSIHLPMILTNLSCSSLWFLYGLFALGDVLVWAPNGVGVTATTTLILLWFIFPSKDKSISQNEDNESDDSNIEAVRKLSSSDPSSAEAHVVMHVDDVCEGP